MKKSGKLNVRTLTQVALLVAVMLVLVFTPLGYIRLPLTSATTMHIPVIIGACMLGPGVGAFLGLFFGITSVVNATLNPSITSFVFTPFYSFSTEFSGAWYSLVVAIVPRILIGVVSGYVYKALHKVLKKESIALAVAGVAGSMTNTIGVMGLIYILFGEQYAAALDYAADALLGVIMTVVGVNGVPEAIIAGVLTVLVCKALQAVYRRMGTPVHS